MIERAGEVRAVLLCNVFLAPCHIYLRSFLRYLYVCMFVVRFSLFIVYFSCFFVLRCCVFVCAYNIISQEGHASPPTKKKCLRVQIIGSLGKGKKACLFMFVFACVMSLACVAPESLEQSNATVT